MSTFHLAALPGDGIGKEVMVEALKLLRMIEKYDHTIDFEIDEYNWNSEFYLKHHKMMPDNGLETLSAYDAILFGAIGDKRVPDYISIWELIMPIRKQFKQYINFRPIKQLKGINSPLSNSRDIDFTIIRENAEGEYSNIGGSLFDKTDDELAVQNSVMTRKGIKDVTSFAFEYATDKGLSKVTSATKSNAIIHSMRLWDKVVQEVAEEYKDIKLNSFYIDALAALFVQKPETFEVIVASNLFGDILSDLGSALVGGLGISPSANINPTGEYPSMFEPVHGSAPDIAGEGLANPIAQFWSTALMLEHLGRGDISKQILQAIESTILSGKTTPDLGGTLTTTEVSNEIFARMF
ncbi:tartrate dehydrogenase [Virgibacillus necropolis]|uniref:tartrate dehydrogenase n=1 Tax=Virgibacillus necropolis TaxID=163877 RepID=UPI00384FEE41